MKKILLGFSLGLLVMACQSKKTEETAATTASTETSAAQTAPAATESAPTVDIWASELGAKLKADYKANPANQAEIDQNVILEFAAKNNMDVKRTASGLYYVTEAEGKGNSPKATDKVSTHYRGRFLDGREFDSSYKRNAPATFGVTQVIPGWTEALMMMKPGGKVKLLIPSALGYGQQGYPGAIPGNTVLAFDLELIDIIK